MHKTLKTSDCHVAGQIYILSGSNKVLNSKINEVDNVSATFLFNYFLKSIVYWFEGFLSVKDFGPHSSNSLYAIHSFNFFFCYGK